MSVLILLTLLGDLRSAANNSDFAWLNLGLCPVKWARGFTGFLAALLLVFAIAPSIPMLFRALAVVCVLGALGISTWNTAKFYEHLRDGAIQTHVPIPLTLHFAALFVVVLAGLFAGRRRIENVGRDLFITTFTFVICVFGFPVAQMFCEGQIDERRPADAATVFACDLPENDDGGAILRARVKTACDLYNEKLVRAIVLSGTVAADGVDQTEVMRHIAIECGVAEADIVPATTGNDLGSAVKGSLESLREHELYSVLAVNDFYLLPRVRLAFRRAGFTVQSVPASESTEPATWRKRREEIAREAIALWKFYAEPLKF